ncbi:immunodominant hypodermal antigen Ac16 [Aphelenchoides avenae]|nr:immunodominant hypodermal antigen Ac16 [Aphelenchus avenae]
MFHLSIRFAALVCIFTVIVAQQDDGKPQEVDIPKFLESIPPESRKEMDSIILDGAQTKQQMLDRLNAWAAKQNSPFPEEYRILKESFEQARMQLEQMHVESLKNAPPEAQNAQRQIDDIRNNMMISRNEERRQIAVGRIA